MFPGSVPWFSMRTTLFLTMFALSLPAADLRISLAETPKEQRMTARFECDANSVKTGLPPKPFSVEYINAGENHLAILPIAGQSRIFVSISSGSGARYASGDLIWWEAAGRSITLTSDSLSGKTESSCHPVKGK